MPSSLRSEAGDVEAATRDVDVVTRDVDVATRDVDVVTRSERLSGIARSDCRACGRRNSLHSALVELSA